jgi:hypothetical protein
LGFAVEPFFFIDGDQTVLNEERSPASLPE